MHELQIIEWIPCFETSAYIYSDHSLFTGTEMILITYEAKNKRRYVKKVKCVNGRVASSVNGKIIAWAKMPEPYAGYPLDRWSKK